VDGEERRYQELEATTVGHDLTKGTSMFRRTRGAVDQVSAAAEPVRSAEVPTLRPVESVGVRLAGGAEAGSDAATSVVGPGAQPAAGPGAQPGAA
jgi:hypothetical protein